MPIYELSCETGHRSETLQASAAPLPACPACGAATRKLPSGFGVGGSASVPRRPSACRRPGRAPTGAPATTSPTCPAGPDAVVLADGFSCRAQLDHLAGWRALQLAELLASGRR